LAARLLGAYEERDRRGLIMHLVTEDRLLEQARRSIEKQLAAPVLAAEMDAGARLGAAELFALVSDTAARLEQVAH